MPRRQSSPSRSDRIRVLIADDHPALRAGLVAVILAEDDLVVADQADNGEQAVVLYRTHRPDVVLMDLRMPVLGGVAATQKITAEFPDARVLALTTYQGDADVRRALDAGARGYLLKHMLMTEVIAAIRAVHRGEWVIPPAVAATLAQHNERDRLTPRELEVLGFMVQGLSNKEIARAIGRTGETVKIHLKSVFAKLQVGTRTEAVRVAVNRGLVHLD
ncbi:MAG TPA: response regulator transcription factor [Gemmatimonadales bacterium]|nr:response regulator transcription factor [Gemmatimonadales bacterium]